MVLVPRDTAGVTVERMLQTMGWYDAPSGHGQVRVTDVRVPLSNVIGRPGGAFAIPQGRLGPGRARRHPYRVREADREPRREPRADCRRPDGDPAVPAARAARGLAARHDGLLGALSAISQIKVVVPNML
jgi:acyl-CoA dehydrogenase